MNDFVILQYPKFSMLVVNVFTIMLHKYISALGERPKPSNIAQSIRLSNYLRIYIE